MYMHYYGYGRGWGDYGYQGHAWMTNLPLWFMGPIIGLIAILALWSLFWKGLALWHAARRGQPWWFVIMLVLNTLGILELIYLFFVAKLHWRDLFSRTEHGSHHAR